MCLHVQHFKAILQLYLWLYAGNVPDHSYTGNKYLAVRKKNLFIVAFFWGGVIYVEN